MYFLVLSLSKTNRRERREYACRKIHWDFQFFFSKAFYAEAQSRNNNKPSKWNVNKNTVNLRDRTVFFLAQNQTDGDNKINVNIKWKFSVAVINPLIGRKKNWKPPIKIMLETERMSGVNGRKYCTCLVTAQVNGDMRFELTRRIAKHTKSIGQRNKQFFFIRIYLHGSQTW